MKTVNDFWKNPRDYLTECIARQDKQEDKVANTGRVVIEPVHALWIVLTHEVDAEDKPFHGAYLIDAPDRRGALKELGKCREPGSCTNVSVYPFTGEIYNGSQSVYSENNER